MKISLSCVVVLFTTMLLTSCASVTSVSDAKSIGRNNDAIPQTRLIEVQSKLINKRASVEINSVKPVVDKSTNTIVLNDIMDETSTLFTDFLIKEAETYIGTPYRYGGTTKKGIDCSAFVKSVFETFNLNLPRVSADQAKQGVRISREEAKIGDLLFFATKGGARVSHVGIVHDKDEDGTIKFIHSSTSKGVVVTSLNDSYWGKRFLYVKRILE